MNYELLKKLKNAGFPQGPYQRIFDEVQEHPERAETYAFELGVKNLDEIAYRATLSELIQACGKEFALESANEGKKWVAHCFGDKYPDRPKGEGDTPEEAVANLWLNINHK